MKIDHWLDDATAKLSTTGVESAMLDAQLLLVHVTGQPREWLLAHGEYELSGSELEKAIQLCTRRAEREPLAYILGSKEFYGREFMVNENVLIPRPESEAIIDVLKDILKHVLNDEMTIYDIGTGSGCLAITAKLEAPEATIVASDISHEALAVAKRNAQALGATISFIQSDLLQATNYQPPTIILANLPYVPDELVTSKEITHEPRRALFSGEDGLDHYRRFWQQVTTLKTKPAYIIIESLASQHKPMVSLAKQAELHCIRTKDLIQVFSSTELGPQPE